MRNCLLTKAALLLFDMGLSSLNLRFSLESRYQVGGPPTLTVDLTGKVSTVPSRIYPSELVYLSRVPPMSDVGCLAHLQEKTHYP
jgi:hypothetical protein